MCIRTSKFLDLYRWQIYFTIKHFFLLVYITHDFIFHANYFALPYLESITSFTNLLIEKLYIHIFAPFILPFAIERPKLENFQKEIKMEGMDSHLHTQKKKPNIFSFIIFITIEIFQEAVMFDN